FADDAQVALGVEQLRDPAADDLVVVDEEHPDHLGCSARGVGTRHTATAPRPAPSASVNVPPRDRARSARFAVPPAALRRAGSPRPSSVTVTTTSSSRATTSTSTRDAPPWRLAFAMHSRTTGSSSS